MKQRPGNNPIIAKLQQKYERLLAMQRLFSLQQGLDMAIIALNDAFGFGEDRVLKFVSEYNKTLVGYCDAVIEDGDEDPDLFYVRTKLDRRLEQIMHDSFLPWEERYDFAKLDEMYGRERKR